MLTTLHVIAALLMLFVSTCLGILGSTFCLLPIYHYMFEHRKIKLIILVLIGCGIQLLATFARLSTIFLYNCPEEQYEYKIIVMFLIKLSHAFGVLLITSAYLGRTYLLLYQHRYNEYMSNKYWMILLNQESFDNNIWIKNINTFGSEHKVMIGIIALCTFNSIFILGIGIHFFNYFSAPNHKFRPIAILSLIFIVIIMILARQIWNRLPQKSDAYEIRQELRYVILCTISVCLAGIITVILGGIFSKYNEIFLLLLYFLSTLGCLIFIYFSVLWVIQRYIKRRRDTDTQKQAVDIIHKTPFTQSMKNLDLYQGFMQFLNEHFAVSRFLFLTEV